MKYFNFADWIDEVCELFNLNVNEIQYGQYEYGFKIDGYQVAYWDRIGKFGCISVADAYDKNF